MSSTKMFRESAYDKCPVTPPHVILEKGLPGGQMQNTLEVENYTGIHMILGPELSESMRTHADHLGVEFKMADVQSIEMHAFYE